MHIVFVDKIFNYQLTKETISNYWKKSGLTNYKETKVEVEEIIERERTKYMKEKKIK